MASYHGPKARVQRRFGEVLIPRTKYQQILEKRPYPPGDHGKEKQYRSGRRSDYGLQLNEKQKLAFIFNIRETQMRRYFMKARRLSGNTGTNSCACSNAAWIIWSTAQASPDHLGCTPVRQAWAHPGRWAEG